MQAWATEFYGNGVQDRVASAIRLVVVAMFAAARRTGDVAPLCQRLAADHVAASLALAKGGVAESPANRAAEQAAKHLDLIWEAVR